jgi:hypothetical protein
MFRKSKTDALKAVREAWLKQQQAKVKPQEPKKDAQ